MKDKRYEHLKLKILQSEYKYVLLEKGFPNLDSPMVSSTEDDVFISFKSKNEYSLICPIDFLIKNFIKEESGWIGIKVIGEMPFGTVQGLIAHISNTLFKQNIGICIVSSFLSDFFLIKKSNFPLAKEILKNEGWIFDPLLSIKQNQD